MALVVQKFGGSSVGTVERIAHVARRVAQRKQTGDDVVVVVSAMQGETDRLLQMVHAISPTPDLRETDQLLATGEQVSAALLALTLKSMHLPARSLTGAQLRLRTDGMFSKARIQGLDRERIAQSLAAGEIVVATGFQGVDAAGNLTTLGRGGSDTSAVAIAAALKADECEIYTDVRGVYTADPRLCPEARKLDQITFDEMMEMASLGSKVLQIRCVELAMNHNIPIRVRSTFDDDVGTIVDEKNNSLERVNVRGISHTLHEAKITIRHIPDQPGVIAKVFSRLAQSQVNVDVIVQNIADQGRRDISFTTTQAEIQQAEKITRLVAEEIGAKNVEVNAKVGKVSIVGVGMMSHPGVAASMFEILHANDVNILMITTSEIKVTCVIAQQDVKRAVNALHRGFALEQGKANIMKPQKL